MQKARLMAVPQQLAELGALKLTFVGGEPLLHPHIVELLQAAKAANMTTCMVTNASLLDQELMQRLQGSLDWLTFSIDASADALHADMGRGLARDVAMGVFHSKVTCHGAQHRLCCTHQAGWPDPLTQTPAQAGTSCCVCLRKLQRVQHASLGSAISCT